MKILALGDSYTIGEDIPYSDNYPSQLVFRLEQNGIKVSQLTLIAKTGWTTGELLEAIKTQKLSEQFDLVFLLIGVNNQYRGYALNEYRIEFKELLDIAIKYANGAVSNVFVLSIPDWGNTTFASGRDVMSISDEIDLFNEVNFIETVNRNVNYIEITSLTRQTPIPLELLASDGLHPSGKMYSLWVDKLLSKI